MSLNHHPKYASNTMKILYPPLPTLEESLFGPSESLLRQIALKPDTVSEELRQSVLSEPRYADMVEALRHPEPEAELPEEAAGEVTPMPDWLSELIARKVAAREARFSDIPQPGQIRLIEEAIGPQGPLGLDLRHPLAVCLDSPYPGQPDIWYGWLTTPEVDYAGYWDVLLEEADQPCDPLAGMVRLQAPVCVYLPSTRRVLCQLSPARLAAIRSTVAEMLDPDAQPEVSARPGHIAVRQTANGHTVLTGTPLGGDDDPRWRYRQLYEAMLPVLREPVELALDVARERAAAPGLLSRWQAVMQKLGDQLLEQFAGQWQPGPALAYGMGAKDETAAVEGEIKNLAAVEAEARPDGLVNIRLRRRCAEPLIVSVLCDGELHEEHALDDAVPFVSLHLDSALNYKLCLAHIQGQPVVTLDLSVHA